MPALAVSGETINWWAVNGTILRIGLLGVVLVWLYARRLTESRVTADIAALLFAFHPFYWHFSRIAMTEVPVTVWLIGGLLLVDVLWAGRRPRA
jgi:predicted membrane-bound dolichyl-phosphate-mannose-protein mannosyltransferase